MALNKVKAIALTNIDSSTVSGTYQAINAAGLDQACFLVRVMNASNQNVTLSYDGSTDNDVVLANSTLDVPAQTNSSPNNKVALFAKGQVVYVKGTAGTGNIYLSGYYTLPN